MLPTEIMKHTFISMLDLNFKTMFRKTYFTPLILIIATILTLLQSCRTSNYELDADDTIISDNGEGIGTTTLKKGETYVFEGKVFVNDGQILTIEPGAVIRFRGGQGSASSALIVARGGRIIAEGTAYDPIIFTAESDDLEGSIEPSENGLWGGIILLGAAVINTNDGEAQIEGIVNSEPRGIYGGNNDDDNSGILKYVSIRYTGTDLGVDNEINGLTLGGVGRSTVIEDVEIFSSADDGMEIFGGTVSCKRMVIMNCEDDAVDIDLGYRGNGQFWFIKQDVLVGDKLIEIDGNSTTYSNLPYSAPKIYNVTAFGRGSDYSNTAITFDSNSGGVIANSIFMNQGKGVNIEMSENTRDSYWQWEQGNLSLESNIFYNINSNNEDGLFAVQSNNMNEIHEEQEALNIYFLDALNRINDPQFITMDGSLYPIPTNDAIHSYRADIIENDFFEDVPYKGAIGSYNWVGEWTLTYQLGLVY